jgi:hypothetical protein
MSEFYASGLSVRRFSNNEHEYMHHGPPDDRQGLLALLAETVLTSGAFGCETVVPTSDPRDAVGIRL